MGGKRTVFVIKGDRFGLLVVIGETYKLRPVLGHKKRFIKCKCDCGNTIDVFIGHLIDGHNKSCGCGRKNITALNKTTHGLSKHPLYSIWIAIKAKCYNKNHKSYENYGGRGISICELWDNSFLNFYNWSIENGYNKGLTIDRKDNNKGYNSDNCRWVNYFVQANNKSNNVFIEYEGQKKTISQWAREKKICHKKVSARLKSGWDIERALSK